MSVKKELFGAAADGSEITVWKLENSSGMSVAVLDYGALIQSIIAPDRKGQPVDVVLGFDSPEGYMGDTAYLGATVGRVANRIAGASFTLNGIDYTLADNCGRHHLHGGIFGFNRYVWTGEQLDEGCVRFSRLSPDGEEGYPGSLQVSATYRLAEDNALHIEYKAVCDRDTLLNLTNHSYFNLAGRGSAMEQSLQIAAELITENDEESIPTGEYLPVEGTAFDFRIPKPVGRDLYSDNPQLAACGGYDHNYVLCSKKAAVLSSGETGISMTLETDMPGLQLYTANFLDTAPGKNGAMMGAHTAVCLEPQFFPDAVHHKQFPSPVLKAGEEYRREICYRFGNI